MLSVSGSPSRTRMADCPFLLCMKPNTEFGSQGLKLNVAHSHDMDGTTCFAAVNTRVSFSFGAHELCNNVSILIRTTEVGHKWAVFCI